jgi:hypothetical protein
MARFRRAATAHLNRNLLNYPLARDSRLRVHWRPVKGTDDIRCQLADGNISYRLPARYDDRRIPNGFDTLVLFWLLREARMKNANKITFSSRTVILKELGLSTTDRNLGRMKNALKLWCVIRPRFKFWHYIGEEKRRKKALPPPIKSLSLTRPIEVELDKRWCTLGDKYFEKVRLSLPTRAAPQNLILAILTASAWSDPGCPGAKFKYRRTKRNWCRTIGLHNGDRNAVLEHAFDVAIKWFKTQRGLTLTKMDVGRSVVCFLSELGHEPQRVPKPVPRVRLTNRKVKPVSKEPRFQHYVVARQPWLYD